MIKSDQILEITSDRVYLPTATVLLSDIRSITPKYKPDEFGEVMLVVLQTPGLAFVLSMKDGLKLLGAKAKRARQRRRIPKQIRHLVDEMRQQPAF